MPLTKLVASLLAKAAVAPKTCVKMMMIAIAANLIVLVVFVIFTSLPFLNRLNQVCLDFSIA